MMNKQIFCLLLCAISYQILSAQQVKSRLVQLEEKILSDDNDFEAVALIKAHYTAQDDLYDYKLDKINQYEITLSKIDKERLFREDFASTSEYKHLTYEVKSTNQAKLEYIKQYYGTSPKVRKGSTINAPGLKDISSKLVQRKN